jgi:4-amino-4-deoxy-L-arabinose transferase-like glycosyltransferase
MRFTPPLALGLLPKVHCICAPGCIAVRISVFPSPPVEWKTYHPFVLDHCYAAPWYIACAWVNGSAFLMEFFLNHNFRRFTTNLYAHPHVFYFYLPVLLMLTLPWTFVIISALRRRFDRNDALLAWWIVLPMLFFSFSVSKLPGYILPVVPAFAILCSKELLKERSRLFKIGAFIEAGTMVFIGVAFGFFGEMINVDLWMGC